MIEVASGLASIPSSWTFEPAAPSICLASTIAVVVSGQIVVHSESLKARITTRPRKECSETGRPNWSVSVKSGAGPDSGVPGSRYGLRASPSRGEEDVREMIASAHRVATSSTTDDERHPGQGR